MWSTSPESARIEHGLQFRALQSEEGGEARLRVWLADVAQMAIDWLDALDAPAAELEDDEREICSEDDGR